MKRDKDDLLVVGGSIYEDASLHFKALSLKFGLGARFFPWDMKVIMLISMCISSQNSLSKKILLVALYVSLRYFLAVAKCGFPAFEIWAICPSKFKTPWEYFWRTTKITSISQILGRPIQR